MAEDFDLLVQTAGIACHYFDRYIPTVLAEGPVDKSTMQIIASTCLLIAAKFFDRKLPPLSELVIVHDHAVHGSVFAEQEANILTVLEWQLHVRMPHDFIDPLRRCLPDAPLDAGAHDRMMFFVDLSVYCYGMLHFSPVEILGGSLLTAWTFTKAHEAIAHFLPALASACCTSEPVLRACANELVRYYQVCFPEAATEHVFLPIAPETHLQDELRSGGEEALECMHTVIEEDCRRESDAMPRERTPIPPEMAMGASSSTPAPAVAADAVAADAVAAADVTCDNAKLMPLADSRVESPDTVLAPSLAPLLCADHEHI